MSFDLPRLLLLLLALTLNGQAFAAPCGSSGQGEEGHHQTASSQASHCSEEQNAHHCHDESGAEAADGSPANSCEQACSCCPGHCASAIPAAEHTETPTPVANSITHYRNSHSAPLPETTLRPPIHA